MLLWRMSSTDIHIRHAEPADYEAVQRIWLDEAVIWGTMQLPYPSAELWRKRLAEPPSGIYVLLACQAQEVVGQLGLHTFPNHPRRRHVASLGMAVRRDWQGRGVGTALMKAAVDMADRWLNISRLELEVFVDNQAAIRLYESFGFVTEGRLLQYAFRDGQYVDALAMARLRSLVVG